MSAAQNLSAEVLLSFPAPDEAAVDALLTEEIRKNPMKIVVLDDDPTGVQTVHDISVYTDWEPESIRRGFLEENKVFYILTNSRGMTQEQTTQVHRQIADRCVSLSEALRIPFMIISRSDSTLRGHYPLETSLLRDVLISRTGEPVDGEVIAPFFKEGGRYTIGNVHYVRYDETLVPAGETEFAKDKTFGYHASDLREYVEEKTGGKSKAEEVICISLEDLRACRYDEIEQQLLSASGFQKIILNAIDYCDVKVFCVALYRAIAKGKRYLFRSAAALVKVMGGISDRPLLTRKEMIRKETENGGIVVVGSHTQKTTRQLDRLLTLENCVGIEFNSDLVLEGDEALDQEVNRVAAESTKLILEGKTPVCYTKRTLLTLENDTREKALLRSVKISDGVQALVGRLTVQPAFVMAKGGITSSDVGTKALAVRRANVLGQIRPGIPVWETGSESRFPGIPYVIFPGNTGNEETLKEAAQILTGC